MWDNHNNIITTFLSKLLIQRQLSTLIYLWGFQRFTMLKIFPLSKNCHPRYIFSCLFPIYGRVQLYNSCLFACLDSHHVSTNYRTAGHDALVTFGKINVTVSYWGVWFFCTPPAKNRWQTLLKMPNSCLSFSQSRLCVAASVFGCSVNERSQYSLWAHCGSVSAAGAGAAPSRLPPTQPRGSTVMTVSDYIVSITLNLASG